MTDRELAGVVQTLCLEIGSRSIGTAGERRAGEYVRSRLRELGWEARPEPFPCLAWDYRGSSAMLDGQPLQAGATHYSPGGQFAGPLIRARFDERRFLIVDDFRGKVAWFCETELDLLLRQQACRELKNEGAVGVLMVSELSHTWSTKMVREPDIGLPTFGVVGSQLGLLEGGEGQPVRLQVDAQTHPAESANIVATAPAGLQPPFILITAHHEAAPYSPGAQDNAVGVAVLLAIAGHFSRHRLAPRLMFASTAGHEYGGSNICGRGAMALFQNHKQQFLSSLLCQFNLDGPGAGDDVLTCGHCSEALLAQLRACAGMPVEPQVMYAGDTVPFYQWKLPCLWPRSQGPIRNYHSPLDTPDLIDFPALAAAAARYCQLLEKLLEPRHSL